MLDDDLAPELPAPVARRIREHVPAELLSDERKPERKQLARHLTLVPGRSADERETRDPARRVDRERDGPERAHRVGHHIDGRQLERIQDVAQERPGVVEQIDAVVVERIGEPVTRPIDREDAVVFRERF